MAVPTSLDHCVIHVTDWQRSNKFYVEVMGAALVTPARPATPIASVIASSTCMARG